MIHRDMHRVLIPAGVISVGLAIIGWIGLFRPDLLNWPSSNPVIVKGILIVLGCMPVLWFFSFRLHLRSLWVYQHVKPIMMDVKVIIEEGSDHTSYYVLLETTSASSHVQKIPVYPTRWDSRSVVEGTPARVFKDPTSGKPLVIEIDGKRLWTMAL